MNRSFATSSFRNRDKKERVCVACGEKHPIWKCLIFKAWSSEKWETAKRAGLCYRCLRDDHLGIDCKRSRVCSVAGCNKNHHQLLHEIPHQKPPPVNDPPPVNNPPPVNDPLLAKDRQPVTDLPPVTERDITIGRKSYEIVDKHEGKSIALRTVPVILKNGDKLLLVNCFLDEDSDTTYVNENVIEQLGIQKMKKTGDSLSS